MFQIDMTWSGEDLDSGIYNYQVALSTKPDNYPDIVQFLSTHSHNHFNFYHPGLYDGQLFYIRLKAQNRAGLVTNKVKIISGKCVCICMKMFLSVIQLTRTAKVFFDCIKNKF